MNRDYTDIRCDSGSTFWTKKGEYLKDRLNELEINIQNKILRDPYRGISGFKKGYQRKTNLIKGKEC
jgi:Txe/YoeB family toxin of Txe-Axe toxin-antitoxin module